MRPQPPDVERLIGQEHPALKIWRVVVGLALPGFEANARAFSG